MSFDLQLSLRVQRDIDRSEVPYLNGSHVYRKASISSGRNEVECLRARRVPQSLRSPATKHLPSCSRLRSNGSSHPYGANMGGPASSGGWVTKEATMADIPNTTTVHTAEVARHDDPVIMTGRVAVSAFISGHTDSTRRRMRPIGGSWRPGAATISSIC